MKIIVVDDEESALSNFFVNILDDPSLEYKMFKDPETALEYVKKNKPDAAFLDINMPKLNGVELAEKLIALNQEIAIVFISAYIQNENEITNRLGKNLKGFCYKPYRSDTLYGFINSLNQQSPAKVVIKTFGLFNVFLFGKTIRFSCAKSKELLALLVDKNGAGVPLSTSVSCLWPDKPVNLAKKLYRDAVIRLKLTLKELGIDGLVFFYRAELAANRLRIDCDFWNALETGDFSAYHGEYMTQYVEWSDERQEVLNKLKEANA